MAQALFIGLVTLAGFLAECLLNDLAGRWFKPNFIVLIIVFFNFFRGVRYSLLVAVLGGFLKDSFSANLFGLNIFSFVICAYLTTFLKMYLYHANSRGARVVLAFFACVINLGIQLIFTVMSGTVDIRQAFTYVLAPEILATTIIAQDVFELLKRCASKLFA